MTQTEQLVDALKRVLKARGITYRSLAGLLGLSESTIKRNFAEQSFTLQRLEAVTQAIDISLYDLARMTRMKQAEASRNLSEKQEAALAADPILLTYFYLLLTGWTATRIARRFDIDATRSADLLDRLADIGVLQRLPRNRVRLLCGRRINWRRGGPVRRLYEARVKAEFMSSRFDGSDELMRLEAGELSEASVARLRRKIGRLANDFEESVEMDMALRKEQKQAFAMLLAYRPWTFWSLVNEHLPNAGTER